METRLRAGVIACGIFLLTFAVYLFTMVPGITEDDSGEQAAVCATLGTAHSPGYPFYCLAGKAAVTIVPWANRAYRVNLISALFIALAAAVLVLAMSAMDVPLFLAASLSLLFAFSQEVWGMANVTEVYGIAAFMASLICLLLPRQPSLPGLILVAYAFGIGVTAHYTVGLLGLGIGWWMYERGRSLGGIRALGWGEIVLFAATGFSLVLYLFIRAKTQPLIAWEDPQTLPRFWQVIARLRYGSLALAQGGPPPLSATVFAQKMMFYFQVMARDLTWIGLAAFFLGFWRCAKDRSLGWALVLLFLASGPGFLMLANVGLGQGSAELLKRFFFLSFMFAVLIMARAVQGVPGRYAGVIALAPVLLLANNFPALNHRHEFLFYDYGKNILRSLPENTLLFSDRADEMEFALAYLHLAERRRTDIAFIDCNAGVSRSIYGDDYYRVWGKPRLARREKIEKEIIAGARRPVYYATFEPDMIDLPRYPEGLVYRAKPGTPAHAYFPFGEVYALRTDGIETGGTRAEGLMLSHFRLLGGYCLEMNDAANAERNFRALVAYDGSGRWTSNIGFLYHQKGMLSLAEKYYRRVMDAGRAGADIYTNLGALCETQGRQKEARTMYLAALSVDPEHVQSHYNLAVLYWKLGNWQAVVDEFSAVLRLDPQNKDARAYQTLALQRMKK